MKNLSNIIILKYFTFIIATFLLVLSANATEPNIIWSDEIWFTNTYSGYHDIAAYENNVHVVWSDLLESGPYFRLKYKKSINSGETWMEDVILANYQDPWQRLEHSIDVYQYSIHIVWAENRGGISNIYYKGSHDNGKTWCEEINLSNSNLQSVRPDIAVNENGLHVVWEEIRESYDIRIFYKQSIDGGSTWANTVELCPSSFVDSPAIAVNKDIIHVAYKNRHHDTTPLGTSGDIFYLRSSDNGNTWSSPELLATFYGYGYPLYKPGLAASKNNVHLVWFSNINQINDSDIFHLMSSDKGLTWSDPVFISDNSISLHPIVSLYSDKICIAWIDSLYQAPGSPETMKYILSSENDINYNVNMIPSEITGFRTISLSLTNDSIHLFGIKKYFDEYVFYKNGKIKIPINIDIKPGSYPNCININGHGLITVAILGSETFDPNQINISTLKFAGLDVRVKGNSNPQCSFEDVSGDFNDPSGLPDGYDDLVCHFLDNTDTWSPNNGTATITGALLDGTPIEGTDTICIVP